MRKRAKAPMAVLLGLTFLGLPVTVQGDGQIVPAPRTGGPRPTIRLGASEVYPGDRITVSGSVSGDHSSVRVAWILDLNQNGELDSMHSAALALVMESGDYAVDLVRARISDGHPLQLLVNAENRGKGYSVRRGMLEALGDLVLMSDADLSCPPEELDKLLPWLDRGCDVVLGSRDMPDSLLDPPQPFSRRLMARGRRLLRRRLFLPDICDTQCGFKLFRREVAHEVFSRLTIDGWLFDCEALGLADRLGYRIQEVGVTWQNDPDSRVQPLREPLSVLTDLLRIRRRLASTRQAHP